MSDRCYMEIECAKKDYDAVLDDYFPQVMEEDGDYVKASEPEANYAYAKELEEWAEQGIAFLEPIPITFRWPISSVGLEAQKARCMDAQEQVGQAVANAG